VTARFGELCSTHTADGVRRWAFPPAPRGAILGMAGGGVVISTVLAGGAVRHRSIRWPALYLLGYFLLVGLTLALLGGGPAQVVFFGVIGVSTGAGFLIQARARPRRKVWGKKLSLALVGLGLLLGAGIFGRQSFQLEGFFFYLLAGVSAGVVTHYLVAKIVGPLFIGRAWCGWGCWIWMVLDWLPWKRSPGRRPGLGRLRVVHLALSFTLVAVLVYAFGYHHGFEWKRTDGLWWFVGSCGLYYAAGIALAAALRDNRAFCKYLCPNSVLLRAGNRLSLLKVSGHGATCDGCGACDRICPMDVRVASFVQAGTRVLDPECTVCQSCIAACPQGSLALTLGLDAKVGRKRISIPA
jgi:ferredoxin-type protein NapH